MVLKEKLCWAKKQNIILKTDIRLPDTIAIDDLDLYILLSNLLDNAIENCDKGVAKIDMIAELKNEFLIITVCNPIIESVLKGNHKIKTTKKDKDNHGYGISSMNKIAKKYSGKIEFKEEQNYFISKVILRMN